MQISAHQARQRYQNFLSVDTGHIAKNARKMVENLSYCRNGCGKQIQRMCSWVGFKFFFSLVLTRLGTLLTSAATACIMDTSHSEVPQSTMNKTSADYYWNSYAHFGASFCEPLVISPSHHVLIEVLTVISGMH